MKISDTHQPLVYADYVHVLSEYIFTVENVTEVLLVASKEGVFFYSRVWIFSSFLRFHLIYGHSLCDPEINKIIIIIISQKASLIPRGQLPPSGTRESSSVLSLGEQFLEMCAICIAVELGHTFCSLIFLT